jgi:hypothetical protein
MKCLTSNSVKINTPLGILSFGAAIEESEIEPAFFEIRSFPFIPKLPLGMTVDGCVAIGMKLKTTSTIKNLAFFANWLEYVGPHGYNDGQHLTCCDWQNSTKSVSIGSDDEEALSLRFRNLITLDPLFTINGCSDTQRVMRFSNIVPNVEIKLHYVIAWADLENAEQSHCWYAVDTLPEEYLETW